MARTIALKGDFIRKEIEAAGVITPGMAVGLDGLVAGAGTGRKCFALENDLIGRNWDFPYAIGDLCQTGCFENGAEVNAVAGAAITINAALEMGAGGKVITRTTGLLIGFAMAGAAGDLSRVRIEIA